jgi:TonB-linked SusC/RagA family outer membrane protein
MKRFVSLFTMTMLLGLLSFAQNRVITGTVTSADGRPVPFASVVVKGQRTGTTADEAGNFRISVAPNVTTLTVSASNFTAQDIALGAGTTYTVTLNPGATTSMTEIVVTGLGIQRTARELGYSTAKIRTAELTQAKVVNLQNGLTGKVSGLNVQTTNNGVFADTRITLRGIRSLTGNNQPMLVLDGVPISLGFINSINPNDIADVTVLKSASATAIYGPDGVNGAIIVTTKKGSKTRPSVSFSHTVQLERVSFMPEFQNTFGSGSSEDINGFGIYDPIENQQYGDAFDGSRRLVGRKFPNGDSVAYEYIARPDEKRKFWNTGVHNQTDVSFSSGGFYLSAQNVDIRGIVPGDKNKRTSLHMSANQEFGKLKASFSLQYTQQNYDIHAGSSFGNGRDWTAYWNLINTPSNIPITRYKNWRTDYFANPNGYFNDYYHNPYWVIDNFRGTGRSDDLLGNVEFNFKATNWLNFTYRLGGTYTAGASEARQYAFTYNDFVKAEHKSNAVDLNSAVLNDASNSSRLNSEFFINAKHSVGKFKFDGLLGHSYRQTKSDAISISAANLGIPSVFNVAARKGEPGASEANSMTRLQRFFGQASVHYNDWAHLSVTGSYDMDSRLSNPYNFNMDDISFFYPGVTASLILSEAIPALRDNKTLSYLKLRGGVSKTGNVNLGAYSLENTYTPGTGFPYGTLLGFTANNTLRQSSYQPEFVKETEVGLEVGFLNNRINLEASAYQQRNTNQIITVQYSASTGYPSALLNAADFTNRGLEFDLKLTPLIKIRNVSIDLKANYTLQTNEVNRLVEGVDELGIGNGNFIIKGKPAYTFKLTDYERDSLGRVIVDPQTGLPTVSATTRQFGQTLPKHILGFSLNANWKGLSLSAVADYRGGNQIYSGIGPDMDFAGLSARSGQNFRRPFVFPNSSYRTADGKYVANTDVYTPGGYNFWSQSVNTTANSNYIASGAFWKLRELALSYVLPTKLVARTKVIKGATVALTGRNLFTWIPETNQWTDPEFSNTTGNAQGVNDRNNTPPTRIFGANITLQF